MNEHDSKEQKIPEADPSSSEKTQGVNWTDPAIPVGDAPSLPNWPLAVQGITWLAWIGFLAVMALAIGQGIPL